MPSPRKGGTTPVRRRRGKPVPRAKPTSPDSLSSPGGPASSPGCTLSPGEDYRGRGSPSSSTSRSSSSWTDTTDTSLTSRSSCRSSDEYCSCSSASTSSGSSSGDSSGSEGSSSSGSSDSSGSSSEEDSSDDDDSDEDARERTRKRSGCSMAEEKRGRSWTRRGARQRGGSVLCSFCGRRGYGAMKMVLSCCPGSANQDTVKAVFAEDSPSPPCSPLALRRGNDRVAEASPSSSSSAPSPRYNWSPCSSASSSSTLSEDTGAGGVFSSGEDADAEGPCPAVPFVLAPLHCGGHVAVS